MDPLGINTPDLSVRLLMNEFVPNRYAQWLHRLMCCNRFRVDNGHPASAHVFSLSSFGGEGWGEEAIIIHVQHTN